MSISYINGDRIYYAFLAGAREVVLNKARLNKINVFPVYDSDTGNNLAATFNYIVDSVKPSRSISDTLRSIADASLSGARGNSGIIMASFINGISRETGHHKRLSTRSFAQSVQNAVPYAYNAVSNPVEGTMLTVLHDWADTFQRLAKETNDFVRVFLKSVERARQSLKETPDKLKVLKEASVVDAGAQGFVLFLEGVAKLINTGDLKTLLYGEAPDAAVAESAAVMGGDIEYRYCSEGLVAGTAIDHARLRQSLESLGDSLIIAGTSEKTKVHMHTNEPEKFFSSLFEYGTVTNQKVDDMLRQYQVVHQRLAEVAVVTDSAADLPPELINEHQISIVPININIDGSAFLDKVSVKPEQVYDLAGRASEYPSYSPPSFNAVYHQLSFIAEHYQSVIIISASREFSSTGDIFEKVAEKLRDDGTVVNVINSHTKSGAHGLLVLKAARMAARGCSYKEIVDSIENLLSRVKMFVSMADFKYLVRSGRFSFLQNFVFSLFKLKPLVTLDEEGRDKLFAVAVNQRASLNKIVNAVKKINNGTPIDSYCIVHAGAAELAENCGQVIAGLLQKEPEYVTEVSAAFAINTGRGAVAICTVSDTGKEECALC
ncbi:MAG: DegV family protein [Bacillota bacterium]